MEIREDCEDMAEEIEELRSTNNRLEGQVEDLEEEKEALETQILGLEDRVIDHEAALEEKTDQVTEKEEKIYALETQIRTIEAQKGYLKFACDTVLRAREHDGKMDAEENEELGAENFELREALTQERRKNPVIAGIEIEIFEFEVTNLEQHYFVLKGEEPHHDIAFYDITEIITTTRNEYEDVEGVQATLLAVRAWPNTGKYNEVPLDKVSEMAEGCLYFSETIKMRL